MGQRQPQQGHGGVVTAATAQPQPCQVVRQWQHDHWLVSQVERVADGTVRFRDADGHPVHVPADAVQLCRGVFGVQWEVDVHHRVAS